MKNFLIFLAFSTLAAAMVPRDRKSEDVTKEICAPRTPCRWDVLKINTYIVETHITNDFCECPVDLTCKRSELDGNSYVYRCQSTTSTTDNEDALYCSVLPVPPNPPPAACQHTDYQKRLFKEVANGVSIQLKPHDRFGRQLLVDYRMSNYVFKYIF